MKGTEQTIALVGMVIIFLAVAGVFYIMFMGKDTIKTPSPVQRYVGCKSSYDSCIGKSVDGPLCMSVNYGGFRCGCMDNEDCSRGDMDRELRCIDNECK